MSERQLKPLLGDIRPPLRAAVLFKKSKTRPFVQMPCRMQALKGPEINSWISVAAAEVQGSMQESSAHSPSTEFVGHDEPAEMSPLVRRMHPINGDGALDAPADRGRPEAIAFGVIASEELREFTCHLGFKECAKAPMGMIVFAMQLNDATDCTGPVILVDLDRIYHGLFLWTTIGSCALMKKSAGAAPQTRRSALTTGYLLIFWFIRQLRTMPYRHHPYIIILNLIEKTIGLYNNFTKRKFRELWKRPSRLRKLLEPG